MKGYRSIPTFYIKQHFMISRPFRGKILKLAEETFNATEVAIEAPMGVMSGVRFAGIVIDGKYYAVCGTRPVDGFVAGAVQEFKKRPSKISLTVDGKIFRFHFYQAEKYPFIVPVSGQYVLEDLVFQVGSLYRLPHQLMFGEQYRFSQTEEAELCSETGAPIFTLQGKLLGVTMGRVAEDVFSAVPTDYLIQDFWENVKKGEGDD